MKILRNYLSVLFLLIFFSAHTQEISHYTIQIGTFVKPNPSKFENLRSFGFIYAKTRGDNLFDVRLGGYASLEAAQEVATIIQKTVNENAVVIPLNIEGGKYATVIQLATKQANKSFDWTPFLGIKNLFVLLEDGVVKIMTGIFDNEATAREVLPLVRKNGFAGAFPKNVNNVLLHKVGEFELGSKKRPLIPLDFENRLTEKDSSKDEKVDPSNPPKSNELKEFAVEDKKIKFDQTPPSPPKERTTAKEVKLTSFSAPVPQIRGKIKRTSALRLQEVLKADGNYTGSLDGYYGNGTKTAVEATKNSSRQIQKYKILAKYQATPAAQKGSELQQAVNNLWNNSTNSIATLKRSMKPLAKAYRAYYLFEAEGMDNRVNDLMNAAIKETFANTKVTNLPKFDYSATYAYNGLNQLLLHLRYIHEVSDTELSVPCWLFAKHETAATNAFSTANNISIQNCGGFWEWEDVQILSAIARDLSLAGNFGMPNSGSNQSELTKLFMTPSVLDADEISELKEWEKTLMKGLEGWAMRAPMLEEISDALKIEYYQTQVLLEDHFMNKEFKDAEAKGLAIKALKSLIGAHLKRFI